MKEPDHSDAKRLVNILLIIKLHTLIGTNILISIATPLPNVKTLINPKLSAAIAMPPM